MRKGDVGLISHSLLEVQRAFKISSHKRQTAPANRLNTRSPICSVAKENSLCRGGIVRMAARNPPVPPMTHHSAGLWACLRRKIDLVQDRFTRMIVRNATTRLANDNARAASAPCPGSAIQTITKQTASTVNPCKSAIPTLLRENRRTTEPRGGQHKKSASACSASKIRVQEGTMINSSKARCTGSSRSGQAVTTTGAMDSPAIGT